MVNSTTHTSQLPTPSIFIQTWTTEFNALFIKWGDDSTNEELLASYHKLPPKETQHRVVSSFLEMFEHLHAFKVQRKALGECRVADDMLDFIETWEKAVDKECVRLMDMKRGRPGQRMEWQRVPLVTRRVANDLLQKWREAQAAGEWEAPEVVDEKSDAD